MIVKRFKENKAVVESNLLSRLLFVLSDEYVIIELLNGTCLYGRLETRDQSLKTLNLINSLVELSKLKTNEKLLLNDLFIDIEALNQRLNNARDLKVTYKKRTIIPLRDVKLISKNGKILKFPSLVLQESQLATIRPQESKTSKLDMNNINKSILQLERDFVKNLAYQKCQRIGNSNHT